MKVALKLRVPEELVEKLKKLHPSYGELSRVMVELLKGHVAVEEGRKNFQKRLEVRS